MIVIVDYGMGNLGSVLKAFQKNNIKAMISTSIHDIEIAEKLVLPGVGHFGNGMKKLIEYNYIDILNQKVMGDGIPILGICLGMQLFAKFSNEGNVSGLNWIDANVEKFNVSDKLKWKIPHIGWNSIKIHQVDNLLLNGISDNELFYFVHSYHMSCNNSNNIISTSMYSHEFVSSVSKGNIYGTQFHPEKSHNEGWKIIKNFANKI